MEWIRTIGDAYARLEAGIVGGWELQELPIAFESKGATVIEIKQLEHVSCEYGCEGTGSVPEYETDTDTHQTYIVGKVACPHTYL